MRLPCYRPSNIFIPCSTVLEMRWKGPLSLFQRDFAVIPSKISSYVGKEAGKCCFQLDTLSRALLLRKRSTGRQPANLPCREAVKYRQPVVSAPLMIHSPKSSRLETKPFLRLYFLAFDICNRTLSPMILSAT